MAPVTAFDGAAVSDASVKPSWLQFGGFGLLLGGGIALLELAYYRPLLSAPWLPLFGSLLSAWCGEGVLLGLTAAIFTRWKAPGPISAGRILLALAIGSIAGSVVWQAFVQWVLRERLGIRVLRDYMDLPVTLSGVVPYHVWLMLLFGGMAAAVHLSRQRHARMLAALRASEIARETLQAQLAETSLASLRARIDPEYVFDTLSRLEPLYECDPAAADGLLEELIVFLRGAVAHARTGPRRWAAGEEK